MFFSNKYYTNCDNKTANIYVKTAVLTRLPATVFATLAGNGGGGDKKNT